MREGEDREGEWEKESGGVGGGVGIWERERGGGEREGGERGRGESCRLQRRVQKKENCELEWIGDGVRQNHSYK